MSFIRYCKSLKSLFICFQYDDFIQECSQMNQGDPLGSPDKESILTTIQKTESTGSILEHPGTTKSKVRFRKNGIDKLSRKTESKVRFRQTLQEIPDIKCLFTSEMRASRARQQSRKLQRKKSSLGRQS